jgi:uncharacterized protein YaiI (UPF0178 family)
MQIWVDADACPVVIRDILCRAAERTGVLMTFVANKPVRLPTAENIRFMQVAQGFNAADERIVEVMGSGDLVITADVPLAAGAIEKGGLALNPRGELYTSENVRERLSVRNFLDELRGSGVNTGGPPALSQRERQAFANQLDRLLTRRLKAP